MGRPFCLLALGLLPFAAGYLLDAAIFVLPVPLILVGIVALLLWGALGVRLGRRGGHPLGNTLLLHLPALVVLLLLLYQELVRQAYWESMLGYATQMFYLPVLAIGTRMVAPFLSVITVWPGCIAGAALMLLVHLGGELVGHKLKPT